jgi:hypothetical protein
MELRIKGLEKLKSPSPENQRHVFLILISNNLQKKVRIVAHSRERSRDQQISKNSEMKQTDGASQRIEGVIEFDKSKKKMNYGVHERSSEYKDEYEKIKNASHGLISAKCTNHVQENQTRIAPNQGTATRDIKVVPTEFAEENAIPHKKAKVNPVVIHNLENPRSLEKNSNSSSNKFALSESRNRKSSYPKTNFVAGICHQPNIIDAGLSEIPLRSKFQHRYDAQKTEITQTVIETIQTSESNLNPARRQISTSHPQTELKLVNNRFENTRENQEHIYFVKGDSELVDRQKPKNLLRFEAKETASKMESPSPLKDIRTHYVAVTSVPSTQIKIENPNPRCKIPVNSHDPQTPPTKHMSGNFRPQNAERNQKAVNGHINLRIPNDNFSGLEFMNSQKKSLNKTQLKPENHKEHMNEIIKQRFPMIDLKYKPIRKSLSLPRDSKPMIDQNPSFYIEKMNKIEDKVQTGKFHPKSPHRMDETKAPKRTPLPHFAPLNPFKDEFIF